MPSTTEELKSRFPDLEWFPLPTPEEHPRFIYEPSQSGSTILGQGHTRSPGRRAFPIETIFEQDVAIRMRDGITIYADIFRPVGSDQKHPVPAILPWSPYGKTGTGVQQYENMAPFRVGLRLDQTSGYEKFEGPDPAEWMHRGYAIVNIDARGAGRSEGNLVFWGQQEAEDIYDTIEWIANQPWCNGSVGMAGNSWLAISQINFGSRLEHPALKALAPWEAENMPAMIDKRPLFDEYWESKYINTVNIKVPIYVVASYSSQLHSRGAFHTFRTAKSSKKWLRVHPYQEWYDLYRPDMVDDLQKYFDRFLKGIDNDWELTTPKVRLSLLGFEAGGGLIPTVRERPESDWPVPRQSLKTLFLNASTKTLQVDKPSNISSCSHSGKDMEATSDFIFYFHDYTELAGYAKAELWMSCKEHDDFDVAVQIRKISKDGNPLEHLNYPCPVEIEKVPNVNTAKALGPQGFLRASHSCTKVEELSTQQEVFYQHDRREPVRPGSVAKLEITFWPMGMIFAPGEGIMLRVSGHDMCYPETDKIPPASINNENVGNHVVHTGGDHDSKLILPFI
ncbi:uncharacterized protein N7496_006311 [Penicillium cataractarum]|uniref:Xaa-Pro dipeptidyl-peptidase C-terminal domain-containing protein n=1 Tax=Penicillium cataractarum TaxID=2100454 RepID=A0A9W9S406_9EURO|nr:uncharacterized protein N7496_006311 [Penicillium cataractarum]KAJ5370219.1 hypothetical protein N7496_006311 [Penicillium cataractarum]